MQFSVSNVAITQAHEAVSGYAVRACDQSLLVVGDHFQLQRWCNYKGARNCSPRGRRVHRGNRETHRRVGRTSVKYRSGSLMLHI